jgi:flagellin
MAVVQHNIPALNANRYLGINNKALSGSLEKLSSGYKINRAGDDAAGLAVSEKMRAQIAGITQATSNAQDGISMVQTFEGALGETHNILNRMKTLATQSANGTYSDDTDRSAIELEYEQLTKEVDDISATDFNGVAALTGGNALVSPTDPSTSESYNTTMTDTSNLNLVSTVSLQVGARTKDLKKFDFKYSSIYATVTSSAKDDHTNVTNWSAKTSSIGALTANLDASARGLGLSTANPANAKIGTTNLASQGNANKAIDKIDHAINKVSMIRGTFGSIQNRLDHKINNLNVTNENLTSAESRIRDTDMATEMMNFTKKQVLAQASQSMLAQANSLPQGTLQLLQG